MPTKIIKVTAIQYVGGIHKTSVITISI